MGQGESQKFALYRKQEFNGLYNIYSNENLAKIKNLCYL